MKYLLVPILLTLFASHSWAGKITRLWLTHKSNDPSKIVVNWLSDEPGDSIVRFGLNSGLKNSLRLADNTTLHHVEIPLQQRDALYHYSVKSGQQESVMATFKTYPTEVLRIAVAADWQDKPNLAAILKDDVHLLATAGDHISRLWDQCGEGNKECVTPFADLVGTYPELFRSTPFMPSLGNHDREIRRRGPQPPKEPVYDVDATAFRRFFALPDEQWKWHFEIPEFNFRLISLDFNHTSDLGTTWQSSHPFAQNSEQFKWYQRLMEHPSEFVVTLYNEQNARIRNQANQQWHQQFQKGTLCISGFGYFAERAEVDGFPYYNTALNGRNRQYPDPHSKFLQGEDNYILLTIERVGKMTVEIKSLNSGKVLDQQEFMRR